MRKFAFATILALALPLAACGEAETSGETANSEPLPTVEAPQGAQWAEVVTQTDGGGYLMGNPDAPIKLIEFASLSCSHCADFSKQAFSKIRDDYVNSGRVSFELRNFVRDPLDLTAAMLTRCGADQSYFPLTEQVFGYQKQMFQQAQGMGEQQYMQIQQLPDDQRYVALAEALGLVDFFAQRGISRDQANACLAKGDDATRLADQAQADSDTFEITGTPTFLLNGSKVEAISWPEMETRLQKLGAR